MCSYQGVEKLRQRGDVRSVVEGLQSHWALKGGKGTPVETPVDETRTGISRRTALKRIGVGTAVVWVAPMVMSIETPAFAGSPVCTDCGVDSHGNYCPRGQHKCGNGYFCLKHVGSSSPNCVCVFANFCKEPGEVSCNSDADCPSGYICAETCCGSGGSISNLCVPFNDPGTTSSTTALDVAGYIHCTTFADCPATDPYGGAFTTCGPLSGVTSYSVCQ